MDQPRLTLQSFQTFPQVSWVEGVFDQPVPFACQPDRVAVGLYGPLARQGLEAGSLMLVDDEHNFATALPSCLGDAWEALGSDHDSGIAWFGPAAAVDSVIEQVRSKLFERLTALKAIPTNDSYFAVPHWRSWWFDDGTRLLLVYTDVGYENYGLETVTVEGVVQALFGAHTDDILLHEFLSDVARPLLAQEGFPVPAPGDDPDEAPDEVSLDEALEAFSVGGREAQATDATLLLDFAVHVLVDLMGWQQAPITDTSSCDEDEEAVEEDPNDRALAQTLLYRLREHMLRC